MGQSPHLYWITRIPDPRSHTFMMYTPPYVLYPFVFKLPLVTPGPELISHACFGILKRDSMPSFQHLRGHMLQLVRECSKRKRKITLGWLKMRARKVLGSSRNKALGSKFWESGL